MTRRRPPPVRVVGIGASAGGLDPIRQLLAHAPIDAGLAFVVLQHLAPSQVGTLRAALAGSSKLPIVEIVSGTRVEPDHVYVVPPNVGVAFARGALILTRAKTGERTKLPIDILFRSLAEVLGDRSIGVVLSGTASDGTEGLRAIRAAGGTTFAQDPATAQFDAMPRNAIAAGAAATILPPELIGAELARLAPGAPEEGPRGERTALDQILDRLRAATGVDFGNYKRATIERRIARRLQEHRIATIEGYAEYLAAHPEEANVLYEDLLIHVTEFFRDGPVLEHLVGRVFPEIVEHLPPNESIRVWVAGCSTGQEAYSLALLWLEFLEAKGLHHQLQIFGTDLSERAIETARLGEYPASIESQVGESRLARFFTRTDGGWRIKKHVRDRCVFVRHDVTADPPFSKLDLVCCRNVLIYLGPPLQHVVIPMFHYALNQPGFLMIGRAESITGFEALFAQTETGVPIYERVATAGRSALSLSFGHHARPVHERRFGDRSRSALDVQRDVDHVLLARYAPACVLIDGNAEILQFRGRTGQFLEPTPGVPQHNLIKMLRGGLGSEVRAALQRAQRSDAAVRRENIPLREDGRLRRVHVEVIPLPGVVVSDRQFIVVFEEAVRDRERSTRRTGKRETVDRTELAALQQELAATKEYLHSSLAQNAATIEDLGAANEELQSMNEELVSMNEELQTAKEELQSTNEELETVNEELHRGTAQMKVLHDDLVNLLGSIEIAIIIVDTELQIRRFTPKARALMNLIPGDVGRKITDLQPTVTIPALGPTIDGVLQSLAPSEIEVGDPQGNRYRMQIRPYRDTDNKISGAVISFVDVTVLRNAIQERIALDEEREHLRKTEAEVAEAAAHERDAFLNAVSHELRTPLNAILLWTELLRRGDLDDARRSRAVETIEHSARAEAQLVDDLLDLALSHTGGGELALTIEEVDPVPVVEAAVDAVRADAEAKQIAISTKLDPAVRVHADARRLQQITWHLASNAVKFTPPGGRIDVSLSRNDGVAELEIRDNGRGISSELMPRLFQPFRRADTSMARAQQGLGIGLALVRHLVERQHGSIHVASPGDGHGATFTVQLPIEPA